MTFSRTACIGRVHSVRSMGLFTYRYMDLPIEIGDFVGGANHNSINNKLLGCILTYSLQPHMFFILFIYNCLQVG